MEYLMTYGWALLAIVIVIAALIYLNPFRAPELCLFQQQGFSCSEPNPQLYLENERLYMNVRIWNKLGKEVIIQTIACTNAQAAELEEKNGQDMNGVHIPTGDSAVFMDTDTVPCLDADGNAIEMAPNQEFRGRMIVWYNYVDDLDEDIRHEAQANVISLTVEKVAP